MADKSIQQKVQTGCKYLKDRIELTDLIPRHVLQEIQDSLSSALKVPMLFATVDGKPITRSTVLSTFCYRFIHKSRVARPCAQCERFSDIENIKMVNCPSGLSDVAVPIELEGRIVGYLLTSQISASNEVKNKAKKLLLDLGMPEIDADIYLSKFSSLDLDYIGEVSRSLASIVSVITSLALSYAVNARLAIHDALTGLYNRAYLFEYLNLKISDHFKKNEEFAVIMLDLDRFKQLNDLCGHQKGDEVLVKIANVLLSTLRPGDLPARFGGDEFITVLGDISPSDMFTVANRISSGIQAISIQNFGYSYDASASIGCVHSSELVQNLSIEKIIATADQRLYEDKKAKKHSVSKAA